MDSISLIEEINRLLREIPPTLRAKVQRVELRGDHLYLVAEGLDEKEGRLVHHIESESARILTARYPVRKA